MFKPTESTPTLYDFFYKMIHAPIAQDFNGSMKYFPEEKHATLLKDLVHIIRAKEINSYQTFLSHNFMGILLIRDPASIFEAMERKPHARCFPIYKILSKISLFKEIIEHCNTNKIDFLNHDEIMAIKSQLKEEFNAECCKYKRYVRSTDKKRQKNWLHKLYNFSRDEFNEVFSANYLKIGLAILTISLSLLILFLMKILTEKTTKCKRAGTCNRYSYSADSTIQVFYIAYAFICLGLAITTLILHPRKKTAEIKPLPLKQELQSLAVLEENIYKYFLTNAFDQACQTDLPSEKPTEMPLKQSIVSILIKSSKKDSIIMTQKSNEEKTTVKITASNPCKITCNNQ